MKHEESKISREYSNAIVTDANTVVSKTAGAKFADYSQNELSHLPDDITKHSFGCGNPLSFSEVKAGQVVLDLGCGAGLDLLLASEMVGNNGHVIGVDFNEDMLALADQRTSEYKNIELRKGIIEKLPIESNSVDWVISNCVINLSDNKQQAFKEIARVLKPSGRMIVSDIVAEKLPWWVVHSGVLKAACGGGVISEKQYLEGLKRAELKDCQIIARQYYDPSQLASIVVDTAPAWLSNLSCCGKKLLQSILTVLAKPISKNLWSAKVSASAGKQS
jgi:SAM-dependent methyltransferase